MAYLTTPTELKDFILRKLGSEAHKVELSDLNWDDIYAESMKYLLEYFDEAVHEKIVLLELNKVQDIKLNSKIQVVKDILVSDNDLGLYLAYPGISPIYDFMVDGDRTSVSSYLTTINYMRQIQETFRKHIKFNFNSETKRLLIGEPINSCVLIALESEDEADLYNSRYFHKILEANCWKSWAVNAGGKYNGMTIGNGMTLNIEGMLKNYEDLMQEIKDSVENDEYSFLGPMRLNSL